MHFAQIYTIVYIYTLYNVYYTLENVTIGLLSDTRVISLRSRFRKMAIRPNKLTTTLTAEG